MTTRSLLRRLRRVEQALGSVDELYASIIWDFALTADEDALTQVKEAFAIVTGQPAQEEEQKKTEPDASPPLPPVETAAEPPSAPKIEAHEAESSPPQWVEVRWRPRGEPDPYYWDGDDGDDPNAGYGRIVVDYDPLTYGDDEDDDRDK